MVNTRARTMEDLILALEAQIHKLNKIEEFEEKLNQNNKRQLGLGNGRGNGDPHHWPTQFIKMEFPRFRGQDIETWIQKCEHFFKLEGTPENEKITMASMGLDNASFSWHVATERRWRHQPTWNEYVAMLRDTYGLPIDKPMGELSRLRQTGTVAEFNTKFDSLSTDLDFPEDYLVKTYVAGLKKEIAKAVRLLSPVTMYQARVFAEIEMFLQRQDEKARRVLKDKEDGGCSQKSPQEVQETSKVQESGGSYLDSTNECIKEQEASDCLEKNKSCSASSQECTETKETRGVSKLESSNDGSRLPVKTKDPVSSLGCDLSISSKSDSVLPRDNAKITSAFNGSLCFDSIEGFRAVLCHMDRCEAGNKTSNVGGFQLVPCRVIFSPAYPVFSTVQPAANKGLQLACNFSRGQKYLAGPLGWLILDECLGFSFEENSPSLLLQNWLSFFQYSPTQSLLHTWFKGKLIVMLYGRFCSLGGKDKKMSKGGNGQQN